MLQKPEHLGPKYAAQFQDHSIVDAYHFRAPYPEETFEILMELAHGYPQALLDLGCGTGEIARVLAPRVARVDAVDLSAAMIRKGMSLPGGDHPNLSWICAPAETAQLSPPYSLIVAASSMHWMDWESLMPRLCTALAPEAFLAIVGPEERAPAWEREIGPLCARFSTNRQYQPYDLVEELTRRGLFEVKGQRHTSPVEFTQPVDEYVESFHARNGFSRDRMTRDAAAAFDGALRNLIRPHCPRRIVTLTLQTVVTWGEPGGT